MKFCISIATTLALLARESVAQDARIPSLRAYANELKVSSNGQQACQLPSEVQGERSWTDCQDGEAWETSQVIYFKQFGGDNKRCVRGNGSARTNGSFSDVGTVEDCADKCVGREPGVGLGTVLGFNYDCEAKTCQCLLGSDEIKETKDKNGSTCYKQDSMISGIWPAEDDSACNI